jgi:GNAT superfamily N-acetyltransferase
MIQVSPMDQQLLPALGTLFDNEETTVGCWCNWFIVPVKEYHAAGHDGNKARFCDMVTTSPEPVGMVALRDGEAVGWCAAGPRSRFVRALKVPTYRGRDAAEDDDVWLVPCFFIRRDVRDQGVGRALLEGAVETARKAGARAIEGFPYSGTGRRSGGDVQVGVEPLFAGCGFTAIRRPSGNRVVMRLDL